MADDFVLSQLNDQQLDIVCRPKDENILVIAGAGTGKTRVLISRICSLVEADGVSPNSILAVTFTNKAALEMKERLIKAMHMEDRDFHMWVMTFHSLCARLLHMFAPQAMLSPNFTVISQKDQQHLIKDFLDKNDFTKQYTAHFGRPKDMGVDTNAIVSYINKAKEHGWRCRLSGEELLGYMTDFKTAWLSNSPERFLEIMHGIYNIICERAGAVDFNELLQRTVWLLETNSEVQERLNNRFRYIMIDEFQDTDHIQYKLMSLLKGPQGRVFIVGDDDQAIYGWRGADYENLNKLVQDVPDINLLPLNINYRSTQNILNFANSLIFREPHRVLAKRLLTPETYEQQRRLYPEASNIELAEKLPRKIYDINAPKVIVGRIDVEFYEGRYVAQLIEVLHNKFNVPLSEIAVLYRKNSLSSGIERALNAKNIPYQIYGGLKFYEREEILDAMAYLRLMINPKDDIALARVYNVPKRKLGSTTWSRLSAYASTCGCSVYEAMQRLEQQENPPREVATLVNKFKPLFDLIALLGNEIDKRSLPNLIGFMFKQTGLLDYYAAVDREKGNVRAGTSKVENLKQLLVNAEYFMRYASLQDINVESMDLDEVLPLPDMDSQRKAKNGGKANGTGKGNSTAKDDQQLAAQTLEESEDAEQLVADWQEVYEAKFGECPDDDSVLDDDFDLDGDFEQISTEDLETTQERAAKHKVSMADYVSKVVNADKLTTVGTIPKEVIERSVKSQSPKSKIKLSESELNVALSEVIKGKGQGKTKVRAKAETGDEALSVSDAAKAWTEAVNANKNYERFMFSDDDNHKDSLTLAAERSANMTLSEQESGALALHGFTPLDLLNAFLRTAALTASSEANVVGQIPLGGLDIVDKELSDALQQQNLKAREEDLKEQSRTDFSAFKALGELKGGKKKTQVDSVQMMTIHSAKGLEFEAVIVIGCEEDTLPSYIAIKNDQNGMSLSEERRLAYVAFTRAKRYLVATFSQNREFNKGGDFDSHRMEPSRFLFEAEAETKQYRDSAPFINTPFNMSMTEGYVAKFFTTEAQKQTSNSKSKDSDSRKSKKTKTAAQLLAEAASRRGRSNFHDY